MYISLLQLPEEFDKGKAHHEVPSLDSRIDLEVAANGVPISISVQLEICAPGSGLTGIGRIRTRTGSSEDIGRKMSSAITLRQSSQRVETRTVVTLSSGHVVPY
jgi:hypothetical protein